MLDCRVLSQLCPNNWVPLRPTESHWVSETVMNCRLTRTEWDSVGTMGTGWDSVDLPRNAQVRSSNLLSGSRIPWSEPWPVGVQRTVPTVVPTIDAAEMLAFSLGNDVDRSQNSALFRVVPKFLRF